MPAKKSTAAKKTVAKKPAAKKPAAKKTSTSKATATKRTTASASKSGSTKKPSATTKRSTAAKPATKKTPAKSAAAKSAPGSRGKSRSSASSDAGATATEPASKPRARSKVPFKVGDKVVYPHHGAATIIGKERIEFSGSKTEYFVLEVATDQLTVRVPTAKAVELGVRPVISKTVARKVFQTFKEEPQEAGSNWSRWYKLLTEKINSGDIFQVAEVVRDLTYAQQVKGISPALKRMLAKARLIIISELRFALALDEEEAIKKLDRALPKVEMPVEV